MRHTDEAQGTAATALDSGGEPRALKANATNPTERSESSSSPWINELTDEQIRASIAVLG